MLINDVTTSFDLPPELIDLKTSKVIPYPEKFETIQKKIHSGVRPLERSNSPKVAYEAILATAKKMERWELVKEDSKAHRAQYVVTTKVLKFKDDVVIEVRGKAGASERAEIHMRSRSRIGLSDLGANAQRIESFFELLRKQP